VSLYRHHGGEWGALPTRLVERTADAYVFAVRSPGLSDFAVGLERPAVERLWAAVSDRTASVGEPVTVRTRIRNVGGADGSHRVRLSADGRLVAARTVTVAANGTRQVRFRHAFETPGRYRIAVDGRPVGRVAVRGTVEEAGGAPLSGVGLPVVALVGTLVGIGAIRRRRS
jgi:hypothetical protein